MDYLYKFHFGNGHTLSIWAETQKDAIKRFQKLLPDVVFMTDAEFQKRRGKANA